MSKIHATDDELEQELRRDDDNGSGRLKSPSSERLDPDTPDNQTPDNQTPGRMLRQARFAKEYSVDDLCGYTKLSRRTLAALEEDRFEDLSQPVFVRGYYRKCAEALDIDADELLKAYAASGGAGVVVTHQSLGMPIQIVPTDVTPAKRRSFGVVFLILVLIVVGVLGYLYWTRDMNTLTGSDVTTGIDLMSQFESPQATAKTDVPTTQPLVPLANPGASNAHETTGDAPGDEKSGDSAGAKVSSAQPPSVTAEADTPTQTPETSTEVKATPSDVESSTGSMTSLVEGPGNESASTTIASAATSAAPALASSTPVVPATALTIQFDARSWVNIHDATGKQLLVGIYDNTTRQLDGVPPYQLVIGYGPGVTVRFQGKTVQFDVAGDNTARLTVGTGNS